MTFEEQIKKALEQNSRWSGSADLMWQRVSAKLGRKHPPWRKLRLLWGGAAALLILLLILPVGPGQPPPVLDPPPQSKLRSFSLLPPGKPLLVAPWETVELPLQILFCPDPPTGAEPTLLVERLSEEGDPLPVQELVLDLEALRGLGETTPFLLPIQAPPEPGRYRLKVVGTLFQGTDFYNIWGETEIFVQKEEKGR